MLAFFGFIDPLYLLLAAPGALFAFWAQWKVKSTFTHWSQVPAKRGYTGAQAAAEVLRAAGVTDVKIEEVDGFLSDHYDPSSRTLRLSPANFRGRSVAAFGVAAHEAGHAIQHATGYALLSARSAIVPIANIGSHLSWPIVIGGAMLAMFAPKMGALAGMLVLAGICLFALAVFFQLITVPVELDASKRAVLALNERGLLTGEEGDGARAVLNAAAWTYVAAAAAALLQLLYLVLRYGHLVGGGRSNDE
ncbi:MAG: zinc metallopeptidase [Planctomycetes bacterium]|nr:zinc metallopeptidase [Planctomycetota bacterium]